MPEYDRIREQLVRSVRRICPRWLADRGEDIVQNAMVRLLEIERKGELSPAVPGSYLWRVAYAATIDEIRRSRRRREESVDPMELEAEQNPAEASTLRESTLWDVDSSGYAEVASGVYGILAFGNEMGGYFEDLNGSGYAYLARGDNGIEAHGEHYGVEACGVWAGGYFENSHGAGDGRAWVAQSYCGIDARAFPYGGLFADTDDSGYAEVGKSTYKVWGNGGVSFVQNHPEDDESVIVYSAPEGDGVATYTRGTARLMDGVARVALGETFKWVTNPDIGVTAYVTPVGEWSDLYVAEKSTNELVIRSRAGAPDVEFDFIVYGLRIGFEEVTVVQEKEAFIPSMKDHRERYTKDPDLRRYNALERFKRMRSDVNGTDVESVDLTASLALRDAIHEYDPATDPPMNELFGHGLPSQGAQRSSPAEHSSPAVDIEGAPVTGSVHGRQEAPAGVLIGEPSSIDGGGRRHDGTVDPREPLPGQRTGGAGEPAGPRSGATGPAATCSDDRRFRGGRHRRGRSTGGGR